MAGARRQRPETQVSGAVRVASIGAEDGRLDGGQVDAARPRRTFGITWVFRVVTALAVAGTIIALGTSSSWSYRQIDDLQPPIDRPEVADAVPSDVEVTATLGGGEMVRIQDGLPASQLFESNLPFFYDTRQQALGGAWEVEWTSTDARTLATVQLIQIEGTTSETYFGRECEPVTTLDWGPDVRTAGISAENPDSGLTEVCASTIVERTEIFVAGISNSRSADELAAGLRGLTETVIERVPTQPGPGRDGFVFEATRAQIIRGLFGVALAVPLLWALPTVLFDRATWQRVGWTSSLRRFGPTHDRAWDLDPQARARLWAATAQAAAQICLIIWTIRVTQRWGMFATGAAIIAAGLLPSVVPRLLYLRARHTQTFRGRRRALALFGLVPAIVVVGAALITADIGQLIGQFGGPVSNVPDHVYRRMGLGIQLAALPLALLALVPMTLMRRVAMRQLREEAIEDQRPPILLLRSFADDKRRLRARSSSRRTIVDRLALRRWERFEEVIAGALGRYGPVLAVGQVGERLPPPLGAVRRQFSNEEWQARVGDLMAESSTICLVVGRSTSLAWEIQRIRDLGHLPKTIFVFPPTDRSEHRRRLAVLGALLDLPPGDLAGWSGRRAVAVTFPGPGLGPVTLAAGAQEDVTYDVAIETVMERRHGRGWPPELCRPSDGGWTGPAPQIFPLGETPKYKARTRQVFWTVGGFGLSALVPVFVLLITGSDPDQTAMISLNPGFDTSVVAVDGSTDDVYALLNASVVVRADFDEQELQVVGSVDTSSEMVADSGSVFVASDFNGTVAKVDAETGDVLWDIDRLQGARGLAVDGDRLAVVLPVSREVAIIDTASGDLVARTAVNGLPWDAAWLDSHLQVVLYDRGHVIALDRATLAERSRSTVPAGPTQLVISADQAITYSPLGRTIHIADIEKPLFHVRNPEPILATNGSTLAIEGVGFVTTARPDGTVVRTLIPSRDVSTIAVAPDGDVVIGDQDSIAQISVTGSD